MHEPPDAVPPVPPLPPADGRPPLPADETPDAPTPDSRFTPPRFHAPVAFQPAPDLTPRQFRFTGEGSEYFRIWIVNLLLSVVTLGIYSAWAKVRRLRYFYGHTAVDGQTFGYHATPIAILKGRLIAYAVVILLATLSQFAPLLASVVYFPLVMVTPIILVRAFRFRAANSSFRGIRFAFDGLESEAYRVFLLLPLLVPLTLGVLYPVVMKRQREFYVGESRYGRAQFGLELPTSAVYRIYLLAIVAFLVIAAAAASVMFGSMTAAGEAPNAELQPGPGVFIGFILLYAGFGAVVVSLRTAFENLVWNHTRLDVHRFESRLRGRTMLWLYASNVLLVAGTLGLGVPWARVRMARYRAESLTLVPGGVLATEAMSGSEGDAATGAELSDAMDLDFGL